MKQTTIEWLIEQWPILETQLPPWLIEQAKEMEKQQLEDAFNQDINIHEFYGDTFEQYYNETFKSE